MGFNKYSEIGELFKKRRREMGLTQKDLADACGFGSCQFVSNWERNLCYPPQECLPVLCKMLEIERDQVITLLLKAREQELREVFKKSAKRKRVG
jgi:transcriptional regulator with XRE-family HTH domain